MKIRDYDKKDKSEAQDIFSKYWTDREFLRELARELDKGACRFYVAEEYDKVIGIAGFRKAPAYLRAYAETENPAELYIIASRFQSKGIGNVLGQKVIKEAKKSHFTEMECYSPKPTPVLGNSMTNLGSHNTASLQIRTMDIRGCSG